jgi:putative tricarboxylic transport membrane protein
MMVFGIPGDTVTAVLLGAFMAQGLTPGPMLFEKHAVLVYGIFAMLLVSNVMLLGVGLVAIRWARRITTIPRHVLHPIVLACAFAGSYAVNSSSFDLLVTALAGILGWMMRRASVPVAPMVIAMLCAPGLENALRQSLLLSENGLLIFVERPISAGMLAVVALALLALLLLRLRRAPARAA